MTDIVGKDIVGTWRLVKTLARNDAGEAARFSTWERKRECSSDSMKETMHTQIAGSRRW